jgi:hypothetical protein
VWRGTHRTLALFVLTSSANALPMLWADSGFHVAAEQTAAGKHAALVPPVNTSPRAPLGPSLVFAWSTNWFMSCVEVVSYLDRRYALFCYRHSLPEILASEKGYFLF